MNVTPAFDPKPYIQLFESELDELAKLKKYCLRKIGDLEDSALAAQGTYKDRLQELLKEFVVFYYMLLLYKHAEADFENLEGRISQVGNGAVIIGEQLESLDKQRIRGQEAKDLVMFFIEFNNGNSARLDSINNSDGWNGRAKAGSLAKRLFSISKEVDLPVAEKAREGISAYYEKVEKDLLSDFDQAYRDGDYKTMAKCAQILYEFNGAQSCVQVYVNQHDFFSRHMVYSSQSVSDVSANPLPRSIQEYSEQDSSSTKAVVTLFSDLSRTFPEEWSIIGEVFPNSISVVQMFLQRLFAHSIQTTVEHALDSAGSKSLLHYLNCLCQIHASTSQLIEDLRALFQQSLLDSSSIFNLQGTLSRLMEDLFIPYIDNDKYIERELKCLQHAHNLALKEFQEFQVARKNMLKNKTVFSLWATTTVDPGIAAALNTGISTELIEEIVKIHKAAVLRCIELSAPTEVPKNCSVLFSSLLDFMGKRYIEAWLDLTIEDILGIESKLEPDLKFLSLISNANVSIHKMQDYFVSSILPQISAQPTVHRDLLIKKNEFVAVLETKVNLIIQKAVDLVVGWMSHILLKQKKFDYRPKENEVAAMASLTTTPCGQCCDYIRKLLSDLKKFLDGKNLENVLMEVGTLFHRFLIEHLKKFVINTHGGLLLTKDLAKYQETMSLFKIPAINDRFEALRQLGNLYLVKPENMRTVIDDGVFARMDPAVLHIFVMNRADYKQSNLESLFAGVDAKPKEALNKWEKTFEDAVGAVGDTFEEVGESIKKILFV